MQIDYTHHLRENLSISYSDPPIHFGTTADFPDDEMIQNAAMSTGRKPILSINVTDNKNGKVRSCENPCPSRIVLCERSNLKRAINRFRISPVKVTRLDPILSLVHRWSCTTAAGTKWYCPTKSQPSHSNTDRLFSLRYYGVCQKIFAISDFKNGQRRDPVFGTGRLSFGSMTIFILDLHLYEIWHDNNVKCVWDIITKKFYQCFMNAWTALSKG